MSSVAKKIISEKSYTLQLVTGYDGFGKAVFAFVVFNQAVFEKLLEKAKNHEINLSDSGIILSSGIGHQPSELEETNVINLFREKHLKNSA